MKKKIELEKLKEVASKAIESYFKSDGDDIKVEIDNEFNEWIQQKEAVDDLTKVLEGSINEIQNKGGMLNEVVINKNFKFNAINEEKTELVIEYSYT